jgi:hypothetical protein
MIKLRLRGIVQYRGKVIQYSILRMIKLRWRGTQRKDYTTPRGRVSSGFRNREDDHDLTTEKEYVVNTVHSLNAEIWWFKEHWIGSHSAQRWYFVRSAKCSRLCILGFMNSAFLKLCRVWEFDAVYTCTAVPVFQREMLWSPIHQVLITNNENTSSPKWKDDISMLI